VGTEQRLYLKHPTDTDRLLEVATIYSRILREKVLYDVYLVGSNQIFITYEADVLLKSLEVV
jgi:hypothetical protein